MSCGPTQNESTEKNILYTVFELSVWQCKGRPTRYELRPATWDLTCDLGGWT